MSVQWRIRLTYIHMFLRIRYSTGFKELNRERKVINVENCGNIVKNCSSFTASLCRNMTQLYKTKYASSSPLTSPAGLAEGAPSTFGVGTGLRYSCGELEESCALEKVDRHL